MNISELIKQSIQAKQSLLETSFITEIQKIGDDIIHILKNGNSILTAGNGGSAADAQHFAAELAGKFIIERKGLPAMALTTNTSILTAIGNDFSYNEIFSRQIDAYGKSGDLFFGISTSGHSLNIIEGMKQAKKQGLKTIGLLGGNGGKTKELCDVTLIVPSSNTQNIQESHIMLIHIWCAMVDDFCKKEGYAR